MANKKEKKEEISPPAAAPAGEPPKVKEKKTPWQIIKSIFSWLVTIVAVFMMIFTVVSVLTFDRNDRNIFGYKAFIVLSDSMNGDESKPETHYFSAGDLVLSKEVDPATLQPGDIITFQSIDPDHYGEIITHKIREVTTDDTGAHGFVTYGTTTDTNDPTVVTDSFVLGKYQFHIPAVGKFFQFLKTTPGYIICILVPFLILILMQGVNSIKLFRQYRREQMAALDEEREKIETEREQARQQMEQERLQSQQMMAELLALKAKLGDANAAAAPAQPATPETPAQPTAPAAPATSAQPVQPVAPAQPTAPASPAAPTQPAVATAQPEQPTAPTAPAQPSVAPAPAAPRARREIPHSKSAQDSAPSTENSDKSK